MIGKKSSLPLEIKGDIVLEQSPALSIDGGELFLTISEITNQAIFICNNNWNILFANSRFADILNYERSDILNKSLFEVVLTPSYETQKELKELREGAISGFEIVGTVIRSDCAEIKVNLIISVLNGLSANNNCFLGIIEDITDSYHLEEELMQRYKLETVGHISGGIIHDFNNNLMGIMCCAEIHKKQIKDRTAMKYANKMIKMATRASDLNIRMLNFIKRGKSILKPCNLHFVIDEALSILEPALGPSYSYLFSPNAKKSIVECDSVLIENTIINLGINARDAMYKGGEIKITTSNIKIKEGDVESDTGFSVPGEYMAIKVSDHGVGIKNEILDNIFEPYFTTKAASKGTGLGLYIVNRVINMHGGYIYVDSKEYYGTTFTIFLPLFFGKYYEQPDKKSKKVIKGKGTIMLVDDEDLIREVTEELLSDLGYKVISFGCSSTAIAYYKKHSGDIDAVLLDMIMPLMTGIEVFEVLKFINPDIKAALLTGYAFKEDNNALLKQGFKTILNKPISKQDLSVRVSELVNA